MKLARDEVIQATDAVIVQRGESFWFTGASIDSRTVRPGELFFAIVGKNRNGHEFARDAVRGGAAGIIASEEVSLTDFPHVSLIRVTDTTKALGDLAAYVLKKAGPKVVAITGSTGKTTTKEMAAALLKGSFHPHASIANWNNVYGLPLSILAMPEGSDVAVLEMGMSSKGEIERLCQIAPPHVAVITNVSGVHQEFFPSVRDIAAAKKEIVTGLRSGGTIVFNGDDAWCKRISARKDAVRLAFGTSVGVELRAKSIELVGLLDTRFRVASKKPVVFKGDREVRLKTFGAHNVHDFLAAALAAYALGVPVDAIVKRAARIRPQPGRGVVHKFKAGFTSIDETYNANPVAMTSVLTGLAKLAWKGRRIAVLGDMLELGASAKKRHREAGNLVAKLKYDRLIAVGPLGQEIQKGAISGGLKRDRALWVPDASSAAEILIGELKRGDLVLLKASNGVGLYRALSKLKEAFPTTS